MDDGWLGKTVSLDCGGIGFFQGVIDSVHLDEQTITLKNAFQNGVACKMASVTIRFAVYKRLVEKIGTFLMKYVLVCNIFPDFLEKLFLYLVNDLASKKNFPEKSEKLLDFGQS